jgi:hypothetical protein
VFGIKVETLLIITDERGCDKIVLECKQSLLRKSVNVKSLHLVLLRNCIRDFYDPCGSLARSKKKERKKERNKQTNKEFWKGRWLDRPTDSRIDI